MGKIISVSVNKGGCGKSTTVQIMAESLSKMGFKCLVVDADPISNLTFSSNVNDPQHTLWDLLKGQCSYEDAIHLNKYYDIMPADRKLNAADQDFTKTALREVLDQIKDEYDFILLDTPSNLGNMTRSSLIASDYVIIPAMPNFYAFNGLNELFIEIGEVQKQYNPSLQILGILLAKYTDKPANNRILKFLIHRLAGEKELRVFDTIIHESPLINEAQGLQQNLIEIYPHSKPILEYQFLAVEILQLIQGYRARKII